MGTGGVRRLCATVGCDGDHARRRYAAAGSADREQWCLDNWAAVCAEIGAAQQTHLRRGLATADGRHRAARPATRRSARCSRRPGLATDGQHHRVAHDAGHGPRRHCVPWTPPWPMHCGSGGRCRRTRPSRPSTTLIRQLDPHALRRTRTAPAVAACRRPHRRRRTSPRCGARCSPRRRPPWTADWTRSRHHVRRGSAHPRSTPRRRAGRTRLRCRPRWPAGAGPPTARRPALPVPGGVVIHVVAHADAIAGPGADAAAAQHAGLDGKPRKSSRSLAQLTLAERLATATPTSAAATRPGR